MCWPVREEAPRACLAPAFPAVPFESGGTRKPTGRALHRCLAAGEEQSCPDPELFKSDVALFFDKLIAETQARAPCVNTPWVVRCASWPEAAALLPQAGRRGLHRCACTDALRVCMLSLSSRPARGARFGFLPLARFRQPCTLSTCGLDPPPVSRPDCPRRVLLSPTPSALPHRTPAQATGATHGADALADVLEMVRTHQVNMPGHICATGEERFAACAGRGLHGQLAVGVARGVAAQCGGRAAELAWLLRPLFWLKLPACLHTCRVCRGARGWSNHCLLD